jgi:hypothetical protein
MLTLLLCRVSTVDELFIGHKLPVRPWREPQPLESSPYPCDSQHEVHSVAWLLAVELNCDCVTFDGGTDQHGLVGHAAADADRALLADLKESGIDGDAAVVLRDGNFNYVIKANLWRLLNEQGRVPARRPRGGNNRSAF